ncbi:uL30 family ribosomal protein [Sulfodiicoccus acidiphilus]|uniref:uL30 family ribosomal protein n=1 Tax=Sulfodiicoccus acidiphilus TaxID=1670455 RepID=UPI003570B94A
MELLGVVRIRGVAGTPWKIQLALSELRLHRTFNATFVGSTPAVKGLLKVVEPYVTWGELDEEVFRQMVSKSLARQLSKEELEKVLTNIREGKVEGDASGLVKLPVRLHPPSGGFKGKISRPYKARGEFGYRGKAINELLIRMM